MPDMSALMNDPTYAFFFSSPLPFFISLERLTRVRLCVAGCELWRTSSERR